MDTTNLKKDFALLRNNPDLIYLDSAASSLTPDTVVEAMNAYYHTYRANIARGVYALSEKATQEYERVRENVADFIGATDSTEIIFTSGTTMSINMIAFGLTQTIENTDHIALSAMEHHANFIPWQRIVAKDRFDIISLDADGRIDEDDFTKTISSKTKILALPVVSNVLGTINPIKKLIQKARAINPDIIVVVDAAQAVPHLAIDVVDLDCDFLVFSAHKMCGPTGVGVLWGKKERLEQLTPLFTGGEMIAEVTRTHTTFTTLPHRLEAGTPNIAGVIGLGTAIDYLQSIGMDAIREHDQSLLTTALDALTESFGDDLTIFGPKDPHSRSSTLSFTYKNYHPHDIAAILDRNRNIALRAGNHCAMPLHIDVLGVSATARASFYFYNDTTDIDALISGLRDVDAVLS